MIAAKIYPLTIPANGSFPLLASGDYFKVLSATSTFEVTGDTFGAMGAIQAGQGLEVPFNRLTFRDTSGSPNVLSVLVAGDKFIDDRITGEVSVIDGEKARTIAGGMFAATPFQNAVAAQFPHVQLWNPAASGKNLIVTQTSLNTAGAGANTMYLYGANVQLATDQTAASLGNKKIGTAVGVALARNESRVAAGVYGNVGGNLFQLTSAASDFAVVPIKGALVVPPGFGLSATCTLANTFISAGFEWFEENV